MKYLKTFSYLVVFIITAHVSLFLNSSLFGAQPLTIPSLQQWIPDSGKYVLTEESRIIYDGKYASLEQEAKTFADDLESFKTMRFVVNVGNTYSKSDIFLTLCTYDSTLGSEGYRMTIGDSIIIEANTAAGVFYGTRTLIQLLRETDTIEGGKAVDYPLYPERGLMVDMGRKYFSVGWLENQIKEMAYIKMNYFHLHFSDNEGFRIESVKHPEIVSEEHLTIEEVKYLVSFAKKHYVMIVPEIDMPSHMVAILKNHINEFSLKDEFGNPYVGFLDITSDSARQFAKEIIHEYIDLFPGTYWHGGFDEFIYDNYDRFPQLLSYAKQNYGANAIASDAIIDFANWMNQTVREKGKTLRVWNDEISLFRNDGGVVFPDTNIVIEYWLGSDEPKDFVNEGHHINNCSIDFLYYILSCSWLGYDKFLYEYWNPSIFQGVKRISEKHSKLLGAKYHIWSDFPESETEGHVAVAIRNVMKIISQGLWGSPKLTEKVDEFELFADSIGIAPNTDYPENPMPGNLAYRKSVVAESVKSDSKNLPSRINDGNRNKQWESGSKDSTWIYVDLADTFKLNKIQIVWFHTIPKRFNVEVSMDAVTWTTMKECTDSIVRIMDFDKLSAVGRFVRFNLLQKGDSATYSIWEIEVYGDKYVTSNDTLNIIKNDFAIYPNPYTAEQTIQINNDTNDYVEINIYDMKGNLVMNIYSGILESGQHEFKINPDVFSQGEFLVIMKKGKSLQTVKSILIK